MKDYGRYILMGVGIFLFVCVVAMLFSWCGRRDHWRNDHQFYPDRSSVVRTGADDPLC